MFWKRISYLLALPFFYGIALLPFPLLYGLSTVMYILLYRLAGYRRGVVRRNLRQAFPHKSDRELLAIERRFYRHLFDLILETIRGLGISKKEAMKRCVIQPEALALFESFAAKNQSVMLMLGHQGNWEWGGNSFSLQCRHQLYVIYHPLSNPYMGQILTRMRTRLGTRLIPMRDTLRKLIALREELNATAFIADQSPAPETALWLDFLNQDTPFFGGAEKLAHRLNLPVIFVRLNKLRRGHYELSAERLAAGSGDAAGLTARYAALLEASIIAQPEAWLWSHRRWKHSRRPV